MLKWQAVKEEQQKDVDVFYLTIHDIWGFNNGTKNQNNKSRRKNKLKSNMTVEAESVIVLYV